MDLSGKIALLRLSPLGAEVLGPLIGSRSSFEGLVVSEDGLGLWVEHALAERVVGSVLVRVLLVKWEYLATVEVEFRAETPPPRPAIGFSAS